MRHPNDGTLRRLLDEPVGVAEADRAHVTGCPTCLAALAAARDDAAVAASVLAASGDPDVDAGWRRLSAAASTDRAATHSSTHSSTHSATHSAAHSAGTATHSRWRVRLGSPLVAVAGVVLLLTGAGVAAAADWWPIFHTEQITPVTITANDVVALPDLSAYGEVTVVGEPDVHQVADAAAAQAVSGLAVPTVAELPDGISGEPTYRVGGQAAVEFTFSAAKAAAAVAPASLPTPPPGLDGATFRLQAGPGVVQLWSANSGAPGLVVARAVAPTGYSSGIPFDTARDYVLSLPGLPADVVSQLRAFSADGTTLPLPLPADLVTSAPTDVNGTPAQLLTSTDGSLTAVVWVRDGVVTAVGGSLDADEVLAVAGGLG